jgi:hypothetical protein
VLSEEILLRIKNEKDNRIKNIFDTIILLHPILQN